MHLLPLTCMWFNLHAVGTVYMHVVLFTCMCCHLHASIATYMHVVLFTCKWCCLHACGAVYMQVVQYTVVNIEIRVNHIVLRCQSIVQQVLYLKSGA